ncbi:MAG: DUF4349 domain-containing protein [Chloroflexota bacterium]|nr:DUF4349 domain-containing protein [Chloroflexota bacterium]
MTRLLFATALVLMLVLLAIVACSGDDSEEAAFFETTATSAGSFDMAMDDGAMMMAPAAPAAAAPEAMMERAVAGGESEASSGTLQIADRKIISTGNITVEVEDVESAVTAVEAFVDSVGGYVEVLSRSGGDEFERASITIRVPQGQFASAYDRIRQLGEVLNEHQGSEDVSEQFIDLEARLNSAKREEQSFLSLLGRANTVSDVLTIERELARVRSDIERYQGQLDFLSRRVDLSTIWVELVPEEGPFIEKPFGNLRLTVDDVPGSLDTVRRIIASYNGEIRGGTIFDDEDGQSANLDARVFYADFRTVLNELERVGDVDDKSIREPVLAIDGGEERKPSAEIFVQLEEPDNTLAYIIAALGVLAALLLLISAIGVRGIAGRGRRRAAQAEA